MSWPTEYDALKTPGMYLRLFHGRENPGADMYDWGFDGPILGPLNFVHTTYGDNIKVEFASGANRRGLEENLHFDLFEDMIEFEGNYYGDWSVFCFNGQAA